MFPIILTLSGFSFVAKAVSDYLCDDIEEKEERTRNTIIKMSKSEIRDC